MIVVLDASAATEIVERTYIGADFYGTIMRADKVLAPDLYVAEVTNIAWKLGRKDADNVDVFSTNASDCMSYIDEYTSSHDLWKEALRLAQKHDHPAYDMLYAALAKCYDATLITMDAKLRAVCAKIPVQVKEIAFVN
ncbi:MAG: type II toxin-antitoxin system VapC family toxin [Clostridiales bacterium]|nr:type II toxin-antitoxin system VapC family toxin [Clostridiales bacterium]